MPKDVSVNAEAWVIKIGGSLYDSKYLVQWLNSITECTSKNIIIVPGGGPFADQVRLADEKFSLGTYAHNMAVMAMQQYANVFASLCPAMKLAHSIENAHQIWGESKVAIWEPFEMVRDLCTLDKTWDVTSDSLAVWLARTLDINNILLIKSSKQVLEKIDLDSLTKSKCIDATLNKLINTKQTKLHFLHKSKVNDLQRLLNSV